jgi:ABC-type oligopeptide transport system substrate-binding subunit
MIRSVLAATLAAASWLAVAPAHGQPAGAPPPQHGIAMHGDLRYPAGFPHFGYVNPAAPKGGRLRLHVAETTFDSFNPFIVKGNAAAGVGALYDTLMVAAADEPFSQYGLLAETVQTPADRSWVLFTLRSEARWHDGKPVTPEDVIWTFQTLLEKGQPFYRFYYGNVDQVEKRGERGVYFHFKPGTNRELPLILGQLPVLPKHWWADREFDAASLEPPLGSGPYRIGRFEAGRFVEYERAPDYWGKDLAVSRGRDNFDVQRYEYFRDATVALEAFKSDQYDFRAENSAKEWATGYDVPAVRQGRIVKEEVPYGLPAGMQGFAMNLRRAVFQDPRVRQALAYAFDFEWSNQALFYGQYARTRSYFENSELAAHGLPGPDELALLEPFRGQVPEEVFTSEYQPPRTDGSGNNRENLRRAAEAAEGGRLGRGRGQAREGRPAPLVRDPAAQRAVRADRAALQVEPREDRHRRRRAHGRHRPVPPPHGHLRLRHDHLGVRPVRVAGQRAARVLEQRGREARGQPQRDRHPGSRRGRAGREDHRGAPTGRAWSPHAGPSTACSSGATTSCPTGTWPSSASRTGTASAGPRWCPVPACSSTPGGGTRRRPPRSSARARAARSRAAPRRRRRSWAPTSSAACCS